MTCFTDQKPRIATEKDCKAPWNGVKNGELFGCYLCGAKFKPGDIWRWVYGDHGNFLVCESCDGEDVRKRYQEIAAMVKEKYWAFMPRL